MKVSEGTIPIIRAEAKEQGQKEQGQKEQEREEQGQKEQGREEPELEYPKRCRLKEKLSKQIEGCTINI